MTTRIAQDLKLLLEETFVKHHGMFTNRGTSLFETLATIDAKDASVHHGKDDETIAGHVFHMTFYLRVAQTYLCNTVSGPTDWDKSWVVKDVTSDQWTRLKDELRTEYDRLVAFIDAVTDWDEEGLVLGLLGILAHNAFHLGALRELNS